MKCANCGSTITWLTCWIADTNKRYCSRFCAERHEEKLRQIREKRKKELEDARKQQGIFRWME